MQGLTQGPDSYDTIWNVSIIVSNGNARSGCNRNSGAMGTRVRSIMYDLEVVRCRHVDVGMVILNASIISYSKGEVVCTNSSQVEET